MCGQRLRSHPKNFKKIRIAETPSIIYLSFLLFSMKQGWFDKGRRRRAQALEPRSVKTKRDNCDTRTKKLHICSLKMGSWLGDPAHTTWSCFDTRSWTVQSHPHIIVTLGHQKSAHLFAVKCDLHWRTSSSDHCWIQSWDTEDTDTRTCALTVLKSRLDREIGHFSDVLHPRSILLGTFSWHDLGHLHHIFNHSRHRGIGRTAKCGSCWQNWRHFEDLHHAWDTSLDSVSRHDPGHDNLLLIEFQHWDVDSLTNCPLVKCNRGGEIRPFSLEAYCRERSWETILGISMTSSIIWDTATSRVCSLENCNLWHCQEIRHFNINRLRHWSIESLVDDTVRCGLGREIRYFDNFFKEVWCDTETEELAKLFAVMCRMQSTDLASKKLFEQELICVRNFSKTGVLYKKWSCFKEAVCRGTDLWSQHFKSRVPLQGTDLVSESCPLRYWSVFEAGPPYQLTVFCAYRLKLTRIRQVSLSPSCSLDAFSTNSSVDLWSCVRVP